LNPGSIEIGVTDFKQTSIQRVDKAKLGCYVTNGASNLGCLMVHEPRQSIRVPLSKLTIVRLELVQLGPQERRIGKPSLILGCISFPKDILAQCAKKKLNTKWITLFDDPSDDEYDGDFTEDDPEMPMIRFSFKKVAGEATEKVPTPAEPMPVERNEEWSVEFL
jgi:hypothetical protein